MKKVLQSKLGVTARRLIFCKHILNDKKFDFNFQNIYSHMFLIPMFVLYLNWTGLSKGESYSEYVELG